MNETLLNASYDAEAEAEATTLCSPRLPSLVARKRCCLLYSLFNLIALICLPLYIGYRIEKGARASTIIDSIHSDG